MLADVAVESVSANMVSASETHDAAISFVAPSATMTSETVLKGAAAKTRAVSKDRDVIEKIDGRVEDKKPGANASPGVPSWPIFAFLVRTTDTNNSLVSVLAQGAHINGLIAEEPSLNRRDHLGRDYADFITPQIASTDLQFKL